MKKRSKIQEGFFHTPSLIAIIIFIVVASTVTIGMILYKQGEIKQSDSILEPVKRSPKIIEESEVKFEVTQIVEEGQKEGSQSELFIHPATSPSSLPQVKTEEIYQDPKEKLIEELKIYISTEEQKKEQTALRLLAEGQFGEYSEWVATSYLSLSAVERVVEKGSYLTGEGGYLGKITKNRFDSDSIFYRLGKYGSIILGDGIWPILSPDNPFNVIGGNPKIYLSDGTFFACLSMGLVSIDCDNRILNPKTLILYMYENYDIDEDYLDYIHK